MKIILDTNFLVYSARRKLDYVNAISNVVSGKIVVLSSMVDELKTLIKKAEKKRDRDAANLAMQILEENIIRKKVLLMQTSRKGDLSIVKLVEDGDLVATMDRGLKKRLKGKVQILSAKGGEKLEIA